MTHRCHWPGCPRKVPPRMWGCKPHWYALPKAIRDRIWATYRPGQEVDKLPSKAYLAAAREAEQWAREHGRAHPRPPRSRLPDQPRLL